MARLYADENFPYPAVEALRHLGHDVLTAAEAGQASLRIPDHEVVSFAHTQGRAILTHNRKHFRNLHKVGILHSGLVIYTEDPAFASLATRVDAALSTITELTGELIRVNCLPG